jgi:iron complex outermembrane receptor protein
MSSGVKILHCGCSVSAAAATAMAISLFLPWVTLAADAAADTEVGAAAGSLDEVVVTATRREEKLKDVPISVSVLSGDSLDVLGDSGQDIKQLAFRVPSLNIESSNGRAFPRFYIRGYGNTDFHDFASQPVSLVYDDIVQENPALKGFPIFDQADVEVLRGPQGTLFGRNSPAGVVKLESAKPKLGETSGYITFSDGTHNTANVDGVVNLPINDQMAFRASLQLQHRDNWINDPINLTTLGGYEDMAARLQLLYSPDDSFSALLNVHGRSLNGSSTVFRANIIQLGSDKLVPGFNPAVTFSDGPNSATLGTIGTNAHLTWNLPAVTLQSITGYETVQKYLSVGDIDGGYGPGFFSGSTQPSGPGPIPFAVQTSAGVHSHEQLTQEFRVVSKNEGPLQGQAGMFFFYENVTAADDDYCVPGGDSPACGVTLFTLQDTTVSRQKNDAEAVFASLEYAVVPAFKLRAGIRYTEDHKVFDVLESTVVPPPSPPNHASAAANNVSWDVSATYEVDPDVSLYTRIATGFRAPSFGSPSTGIPIQIAKTEKNISYETGVKAELFDRRARIAFDVFYYDVSHQQLTAVGGASDETLLINASNTIGKGAELDFNAHLLPTLVLNLSGSLNDTKIHDPGLTVAPCFNWGGTDHCNVLNPINAAGNVEINGNPLPEAARWVGDASLRYDYPFGNGSLYAFTDLSYRSAMNLTLYSSEEFVAAPLAEAGLRLGYTWAESKYDVAAFCRNCANQIRIIGGIDFDNATGYINDPRTVGVQFRARF